MNIRLHTPTVKYLSINGKFNRASIPFDVLEGNASAFPVNQGVGSIPGSCQ